MFYNIVFCIVNVTAFFHHLLMAFLAPSKKLIRIGMIAHFSEGSTGRMMSEKMGGGVWVDGVYLLCHITSILLHTCHCEHTIKVDVVIDKVSEFE